MYTVYMHKNKINGKIYIGITGKDPKIRWNNGSGYRKTYFAKAIKKYGWNNFDHIILFENLTKEEACKKEIELIKLYDANNPSIGYNTAKGGEINCGYHISEERKKHLHDINLGENHPQYGKHRSEDTKRKISESRKGIKFSKEHREKLSKAKKGKKPSNIRPVSQYDKDMNFIKRYESMTQASNETHINKPNIFRAIHNNGLAGGYKWTY